MSDKKRKWGKKSAAVLAFAASLLASNAVSVMAAADETPNDLNGNPQNVEKQTGSNPKYEALSENVFTASNKQAAISNFYKSLNDVRDFGLYAKKVTSNHLECNAAVGSIN